MTKKQLWAQMSAVTQYYAESTYMQLTKEEVLKVLDKYLTTGDHWTARKLISYFNSIRSIKYRYYSNPICHMCGRPLGPYRSLHPNCRQDERADDARRAYEQNAICW